MLIRTIPRDHTSAARGLYTGATLFLHSVKQGIEIRRGEEPEEEERTIAHIRRTTTIHVRRDSIPSREPKIREFDDDLANPDTVLVEYPAISDNEVFWLDVTMKDGCVVACGHRLAHLSKHRGDKAETGGR